MELEFQLTKEDYKEYQSHCNTIVKSINRQRKKIRWEFIWTIVIFVTLYALGKQYFDENLAYIFAGFFLSIIVFYIITKIYSSSYLPINPDCFSVQNIKLGKNEVINTSSLCTIRAKWQWFVGFVETPNLCLMIVDYGRAIPIPKRAFKDEAQMEEFRQLCREKIPVAKKKVRTYEKQQ